MPTTVRPRQSDDLPALVEVLRAVHEQDGYPVHWQEPAGEWITPAGTVAAWVGEHDGRVCGHVALAAVGEELVVGRLFVAPAARGLGLSDLLLTAVEQAAARRGSPLTLEVHVRAAAAIARYERRGWVRTDTHLAHWTEADGSRARAHRYAAPSRGDSDGRTSTSRSAG